MTEYVLEAGRDVILWDSDNFILPIFVILLLNYHKVDMLFESSCMCLSSAMNTAFSATAATAAIEQAQWSQKPSTSQTQQPSSVAANAMAQAQAAGTMGTVTANSHDAASYQQLVSL